jgi:leucyl-tRNA synthetase
MKPNPPGLVKDVLKVHYLFQDWDKAKQGGVICKNEAMINEQKKVFGYVIKSLGKNLFKSRNILNISLPVGIFKKE